MQYIVVLPLQKTPDIVLPVVLRRSKTMRLAKRRQKALFLAVFRQTETRIKPLGQGRHRRNFIRRFLQIYRGEQSKTHLRNLRMKKNETYFPAKPAGVTCPWRGQ
jgi:hypothetical protein